MVQLKNLRIYISALEGFLAQKCNVRCCFPGPQRPPDLGGWDQAGFLGCAELVMLVSASGSRCWHQVLETLRERGWLTGRGHSARAGHRARKPQQDSGSEMGAPWGSSGRVMGQGWVFRNQHLPHGRMTQMEAAAEAHNLPSPSRGLDPRVPELASEHPSSMN